MHYTSPEVYEYISKQTKDPIVERKICEISGSKFAIYQSDLDFYKKISPTFDGITFDIPTPKLCPEERQRRRLMFRNERSLYKRKCNATGETIISIYSPDKSLSIYGYKFRLSDGRNPLDFGQEFSYDSDFFGQYRSLLTRVPSKALVSEYNENCDYTSICGYCKDCYYTTASEKTRDSMFSHLVQDSSDIVDSSFVYSSQQCYECIDIQNCTKCFFVKNSNNCNNCYTSYGLENCSFCINCNNLSGQQYCIDNKKVSKEEFEQYLATYTRLSDQQQIKNATNNLDTENSYGGSISHAKNIVLGFEIEDGKDIRYSQIVVGGEKMMDCSNCYIDCLDSYEIMSALSTNRNFFSGFVYNCNNCLYSMNCSESSYLFGCSNLSNVSYCIFNKQYTKEEYEKEVAKIITHMQETGERGEFFDPSLSPFGYNETVAQEYFPLTRDEATKRGYARQDEQYDPEVPKDIQTLSGDQIPTDLASVDDGILKKILICETSGRPFRIIKKELDFYRTYALPLPRKHPDVRHQERMSTRPKRNLFLRTCDKTGQEMLSVYPQDVSFEVYSEEVYQQEIFG